MTVQDAYATPEEAARGDIPERYAHTVALTISPSGDCAVVLQLTNEGTAIEPYQTVCYRNSDGTWSPGSGGNGGGAVPMRWDSAEPDGSRWIVTWWNHVPEDVTEVIVRWQEEEHRLRVNGGWCLFARWDVSEDDLDVWVDECIHVRADGSEEVLEPDPNRETIREQSRLLLERARASPAVDLGAYPAEQRWSSVVRRRK